MKKLVIMRGVPGSGKSTLTKNLVLGYTTNCKFNKKTPSYAVLSTDEIISASGHYLWTPDIGFNAHKVNQIKCEEACKRGIELVIIDNTNTQYKEFQPYILSAKKYDYQVEVVEPNNSWSNDADQCAMRNTHNVPKSSIEKMLARFEDNNLIREKIAKELI